MIKARWPSRAADTIARLTELRDDPTILQTENQKLAPNRLDAMLVRDLAGKFTGRRTFIEHVERVVPEFYLQVGQHLRAWVPPPPKPKKPPVPDAERDDSERSVEEHDATEESSPTVSRYAEFTEFGPDGR